MNITSQILEEFKERMRITGVYEDENLMRILSASVKDLQNKCGDYDLSDETFKELVFERSRYVYNDALEYFNENFLSQITSLALKKVIEEGDTDEEV